MCITIKNFNQKKIKNLFLGSIYIDPVCQEIVNNGNLLEISLHSNGRWSALFEDGGEYFDVFIYFDEDYNKHFVGYSFLGKE